MRVYPEINRLPSYFLHQPSSEANIRFQGDYLVVWDKLAIFVNGTFDEERLSEALNTGTRLVLMTQEEKWQLKYNEVMDFIEKNHRNPSKHNPEERGLYLNWIKHNKKLYSAGELKEDKVEMFGILLSKMEEYKRENQWG